MQTIDLARWRERTAEVRDRYQAAEPFHYLVIDDFLRPDAAERVLREFPAIDREWVNANGLHTRNKWTNPAVEGSVAASFYREVNSSEFLEWLSEVTGIRSLLPDNDLQGAGYHQVTQGGFLNVHVDFNKLEAGALDRRLNLIVYLNQDWLEEYGGFLELWDMQAKRRVDNIAPAFNRCVVFETNEVSFHGHPTPLDAGPRSRKSLSVYYYTRGRDDVVGVSKHSTIYVNTEGTRGMAKVFANGVREFFSLGWIARRLKKPPR